VVTVSYYDSDETGRAVKMYHWEAAARGLTVNQPSRAHSGREGDQVVLRSGDRELARYQVVVRKGEEELVRV
jgi:hypothetical protein